MDRFKFPDEFSRAQIAACLKIPKEYPRAYGSNALKWKQVKVGVTMEGKTHQHPLDDVFYDLAMRFDAYTAAYMLHLGINNSTAVTRFRTLQKARATSPA